MLGRCGLLAEHVPTAADKSYQCTKPAPTVILNTQGNISPSWGCCLGKEAQSHRGVTLHSWKLYREMTTFVVEDGVCWVGESWQTNHQGKSFHPANVRIEPPLSTAGLRNCTLEWSNCCSVCELRLKSQQSWCLALAWGLWYLQGSSSQAGIALQLCSWWHWHIWWGCDRKGCLFSDTSKDPSVRTPVTRASPGVSLWSPWVRGFDSEPKTDPNKWKSFIWVCNPGFATVRLHPNPF